MIHARGLERLAPFGRVVLGLLAALWMVVLPAQATGWKPNVREGSDIVMKDHRWPKWDAGTYYCFWSKSVRLTLTDIFDQETSVTVPVGQMTPRAAAAPVGVRRGLDVDPQKEGMKYDPPFFVVDGCTLLC